MFVVRGLRRGTSFIFFDPSTGIFKIDLSLINFEPMGAVARHMLMEHCKQAELFDSNSSLDLIRAQLNSVRFIIKLTNLAQTEFLAHLINQPNSN